MELKSDNNVMQWIGLLINSYPGVDRPSHLRKSMERVLEMVGGGAKDGTQFKPVLVINSPCCKRVTTYQYINDIPLGTVPCPCGAEGRFIVKWNEQWDQQNIPIDSPNRTDHQIAEILGRTKIDRWEKEVPHHPQSLRLMRFLSDHDLKDCHSSFGWKMGGDGDNGEALMYEMDAYFETMDLLAGKTKDVPFLPKHPERPDDKI